MPIEPDEVRVGLIEALDWALVGLGSKDGNPVCENGCWCDSMNGE